MAAGFPPKMRLIPDRIPVFGTTVSQVLVKCQWGLFIRNTCLYETSWKQVHTDREYSLRRQVWRGSPGPRMVGWMLLDTQGWSLSGHSPGKVLLVQGRTAEGGLHRAGAPALAVLLSFSPAHGGGGTGHAGLRQPVPGAAGPWLVESARLDGE